MDDITDSQPRPTTTRHLTVGVMIDGQFLREGVAGLLGKISGVVTADWDAPEVCPDHEEQTDVLLITPAETLQNDILQNLARSRTKVLLIVGEADMQDLDAVPLGAVDGAVLQDELSVAVLDDALHAVMLGRMPMPPKLTRLLMARLGAPVRRRFGPVTLTAREQETLVLLAEGLSNKQIARTLGVSTHGAKRLVGSVLIKLGAPNRTAAVVSAIKGGLVPSP